METPAGVKEGERCKHDMLPDQCADCKPKHKHDSLLPKKKFIAVYAKYEGMCRECGEPINEGDAIVLKGYYWIHIECKD